MAKGIYVGVDKKTFSSSPVPTTGWTTSSYSNSTSSNEYGMWGVETTSSRGEANYSVYKAFDGNADTAYITKDLTTDEQEEYLYLTLPEEISIKPNLISVIFNQSGTAATPCCVQGYNGEEWVNLATLASVYKTTTETFDISTNQYFTQFRITLHRYSNTRPSVYIYNFEITEGEIKLQNSIAHKVKKAYVGVDSEEKIVEFTSNPAPTTWTDSSDYLSATATNDYGEWKAEASYVFSSYYISKIFDVEEGNNSTSWVAKPDTETAAYTSNVWLNPPTDTSIKPTKLSITYMALGDNNSIWGMNTNTGEYEKIASWSNTAASGEKITKTITYSGDSYFSKIEIRVSNFGYGIRGSVSDFKMTSGTIKVAGKPNIARKIKKGYIGVAGIARPFFSSEKELSYYGTATALSIARNNLAATSVGDYALVAGGYSSSAYQDTVDTYTSSLVKGTATDLSYRCRHLAATSVGDYALFGGGQTDGSVTKTVNTYTSSLAKGTATNLSKGRYGLAATTVGDYALFGGGYDSNLGVATVDTYTSALVKGTAADLSAKRRYLAATTVGDYALFAGGIVSSVSAVVDSYTSTLAKGTPTSLSTEKRLMAATSVGDYALFGGGYSSSPVATVDTYTSNLVKGTATNLSSARYDLAATTIGDYALFGGGYTGSATESGTVDTYTSSLVKGTATDLSVKRRYLTATTIGDYALFGGGSADSGVSTTVDVYQLV